MRKIKLFLLHLYYKIAVVTSEKLTRRIARKLFIDYMSEGNLRYRISNDQLFIESGYELSEGHRTNVYYDFSADQPRIVIQSHFLNLETHQIPPAALLITHLNTLIRNGKLMIHFQSLSVYFEIDVNYSALVLNPENIDRLNRTVVAMPDDFIWCFTQVLEVNEDPVVVMGEFMRQRNLN
jgi:hypothetical protein